MVEVVKQAFKQLDPEDQKLLSLKIEELPWQGAQFELVENDFHPTSPTLRDRKAQALGRLRDLYHALKTLSDMES